MSAPAYLSWVSYGLGSVAFSVLALRLGIRHGRSTAATLLVLSCAATAIWELSGLAHAYAPSESTWAAHQCADAVRWCCWMFFLATLMHSPSRARSSASLSAAWPVYAIAAATLVILTVTFATPAGTVRAFGLWVVASIAGLVLCEHLLRLTPPNGRWAIKPLCIAVAALFGFDLFLFSDAAMMRSIDPDFWAARGIAHTLSIPLLLVASARNRAWSIDVAVSRAVAFRSTALLISGLYLLGVAATGYYVRLFGGTWGKAVQTVFIAAACVLLVVLFSSGTLRARLKVFISKNFFSYRYDYREEWLKFTSRLADSKTAENVYERAISALADLVESPGGAIWINDEEVLRLAGSWNMPTPVGEEPCNSSFASFLARTGWVVDLQNLVTPPAQMEKLPPAPNWLREIEDGWLVIPMVTDKGLLGFTVLIRSRARIEMNWEVLDLLKTAARQASTYLGHLRAIEALVEARQFDAFNKMSAFVVHDLKNLIAQLSLLLRNAEKHASNPQFQADMLDTVQHVVERMNRLLLQLRSGEAPVEHPRLVELRPILDRIKNTYSGRGCELRTTSQDGLRILGHEDRLERVLGHLVQNAIEASDVKGIVSVSARLSDNGHTAIEVVDNGKGMTKEFIRDVLFKPFRTTKPTGMGIGAFESHQYVSELGGQIIVQSTPGVGSQFVVLLPGSVEPVRNLGKVMS